MEPIKLSLTTKLSTFKELNIKNIEEREGFIVIELNDNENREINSNMILEFKRDIYLNRDDYKEISERVVVVGKDENGKIYTTKIPNRKLHLKNGNKKFRRVPYIKIGDNNIEDAYIIETTEPHNIFPQDIMCGMFSIDVKDYKGEILASFNKNDIYIPFKDKDLIVTSANCITLVDESKTCGKSYKTLKTYRYDFKPYFVSDNNILLINCDKPYIFNDASYIEIYQNPFYYYNIETNVDGEPSNIDMFGDPIKQCYLYTDSWWGKYEDKSNSLSGNIYVNSGDSNTKLRYSTFYWNTDISLSNAANESTLGSYDNFNTKFIENLEQSLIPPYVDMERIKYSPVYFDDKVQNTSYHKLICPNDLDYPVIYTKKWVNISNFNDGDIVDVYVKTKDGMELIDNNFYFDAFTINGGNLLRENIDNINYNVFTYIYIPTNEVINESSSIVTSITINMHFRKRDELKDNDSTQEQINRGNNTLLTSGNVYTDGWFINQDEENTTWWNGFEYDGEEFSKDEFEEFMNNSGTTSDLIGYLNFTDKDIFYRKKKVSQSFLRFSYYTSADPLEQKLLYYSTTFLDSTALYGKYLTQMLYMEENDLFNPKINKDINLNVAVVLCSADTASARVDTKIILTNEYDKTKSSEGFNLYLFSDDKNMHIENAEKTIYMKVEFNHAGNGKTIPLIMWPKDENGDYTSLTVENFIENLYIPVKLVYLNGRYTYYIPNAINNNGNIEMILFEPKLDYPEDKPE